MLEEDRKSSDPTAVVEVKDMYKACMNVGELAELKYYTIYTIINIRSYIIDNITFYDII